jgi:ribokinase
MVKIAVLASFNMDLVMRVERRPAAGETLQGEFAMHLGGKGFNQAVAARRLGADVVVCGRVGDDEFGRRFLAALDDEGIDRRVVVVDQEAGTGVATIYVEPDGTNTIVQSPNANRCVTMADLDGVYDKIDFDDVWVSSFFEGMDLGLATRETPDAAARNFGMAFANTGGLTMLNAAPAGEVPASLLTYFRFVVVNEQELSAIAGVQIEPESDALEIARRAINTDWSGTAVTRGSRGAEAIVWGTRVASPAFDVSILDTTGAGDAFCGGLAVRLAEGAELVDAMRFANAAGALACTKHGAYPSMPYRADVEALIAQQGSSR